ncbi:DinB family protein [Maribacter polysiphoniae]|uniref:DinB family protein n=1 Tax=Maribacter polysiphoniae TaxID=429344 RepID=A0A316DYK1_9FLAO|nr:DinB family protein [Maribacter polysiphoniae]MBD1259668.1 DinB family protein [Maribacter polysiphoniae]PWK23191.1 DinB family protein [Maribacter polysiphoniae]
MRTNLEYIIHDLKECFDGKPWYGDAVMTKLDTVDWHIVNDRIYGDKTIAVVLQHMINWRIFVIKKLQGDADYDIIIDTLNDWVPITIGNEKEWERLKQGIRQTQNELLGLLADRNDAVLDKKVPGKNYVFGAILRSVAQHDIYHLGQIAMLSSMTKS